MAGWFCYQDISTHLLASDQFACNKVRVCGWRCKLSLARVKEAVVWEQRLCGVDRSNLPGCRRAYDDASLHSTRGGGLPWPRYIRSERCCDGPRCLCRAQEERDPLRHVLIAEYTAR